jgi:hypothetical protein
VRRAPKQSEQKSAPELSSTKPVVEGLSKAGGFTAVKLRSPTVIV